MAGDRRLEDGDGEGGTGSLAQTHAKVQQRGLADLAEEAPVAGEDGMVHVPAVIQREFDVSRSEARRLIDQGGVMLGDRTLAPGEHDVPVERADKQVLRVGKRRFRRLRAD